MSHRSSLQFSRACHDATRSKLASALLLALIAVGCSKTELPATGTPVVEGPVAVAAKRPEQPPSACEIVDASAMSAILGAAVLSQGGGESKCTYKATAGISPYAELEIERGDGEIAMKATRQMNKREPGIADPLAGLGDEAAQVGPAFFIRSGKDFVKIVFSGVTDPVPKAKAVLKLVGPKL